MHSISLGGTEGSKREQISLGGTWQQQRDNLGFAFQKVSWRPLAIGCCSYSLCCCQVPPKDICSLFEPSVPPRLIECIADLLKYDPSARLTCLDCLEHPYLTEAADRLRSATPALSMATSLSSLSTGLSTPVSQSTSSLQEFSALPPAKPHAIHYSVPHVASAPASKFHEAPSLSFRKQKRWPRLGMFGNSDQSRLPPVAELQNASQSQNNTPSTKGTQSPSTDSLCYRKRSLLAPQSFRQRISRR